MEHDVDYYKHTFIHGKSLWEWTDIWVSMLESNDSFYNLYQFSFNPHEYGNLYLLYQTNRLYKNTRGLGTWEFG